MALAEIQQINLTIPDESVNGIKPYQHQMQLYGANFSIVLDIQTIKRMIAIQESESHIRSVNDQRS
jgi:hypothetical protein